MTQPTSAVKVAIIGSGLAGLTAAHLLSNSSVNVHLFEKASSLGMDAASISVSTEPSKKNIRIDVSAWKTLVDLVDRILTLLVCPGPHAIFHVR
jgi:predicted NAD/FAD-binding protein